MIIFLLTILKIFRHISLRLILYNDDVKSVSFLQSLLSF